jgi:hypothetical protein
MYHRADVADIGVIPCSWRAENYGNGALTRQSDHRICCAGVEGEAVDSMPTDLVQLQTV